MTTAPILSAALAAISPPEPDFEDALDHTEVTGTDDELQIIAYDDAGEVIGTVALWLESGGEIHLASDYADGYAETIVNDGRARTEATLSPEMIGRRVHIMVGAIQQDLIYDGRDSIREGRLGRAIAVAAAATVCASLAAGNPWGVVGCPAGVIITWCQCAPVLGHNGGAICEDL